MGKKAGLEGRAGMKRESKEKKERKCRPRRKGEGVSEKVGEKRAYKYR